MKNLSKRLEDLETKIIETKNNKQRLREKVEKREKEIHQKVIKIWNKEALNDKSFHSDLNKIVSSFKKKTLKDSFAFFVSHQRVDFQINLNGLYTDLSVAGESFKIDKIQRAKEVYLNTIIDTFAAQNYL